MDKKMFLNMVKESLSNSAWNIALESNAEKREERFDNFDEMLNVFFKDLEKMIEEDA